MEIRNKRDIRLVGRAMREDWPTTPERKQQAVNALFEVLALKDPELTIEVFKALTKADEANLKRKVVELKEQEMNEQQRLRLLEFARSLSPDELARISSRGNVGNQSSD